MKLSAKTLISRSFYRLLAGLVRLALRNGLTHKELSAIEKQLYVHIAAEEYGLQGRKTNMARIALMTGIDRKEISRILGQTTSIETLKAPPDRMSQIITTWYEDPSYLDSDGKPLTIPVEGPAPSFTHLVKSFGGDIAVVTVLREFKHSQTVKTNDAGDEVTVQKRHYVPNYRANSDKDPELANPEAIAQGSSMLIDHINTIFHNLYRDDTDRRERFDLRATNVSVDKESVDEFYRLVDRKGMEFLQEIDHWLHEHQVKEPDENSERLGVGLYFIEGANGNIEQKPQKPGGSKGAK